MVGPGPVIEGFSIEHAQICDGATDFLTTALATTVSQDLDIFAVNEGSLDPDTDNFDNEGDNKVVSRWNWLNNAELSVQAGFISFPVIAKLTGRAIASSGTGAATSFAVDLWHEDDFNMPTVPFLMRCPSKDKYGNVRRLTIGLYKVQFSGMTFDGPKYRDGLKGNYGGTALFSDVDEKGVAFPDGKSRVGRLISHQ